MASAISDEEKVCEPRQTGRVNAIHRQGWTKQISERVGQLFRLLCCDGILTLNSKLI